MTHQLNKRPFQFLVSNSHCLFLHFRITISGNVVKVSEILFNIVFLNELFHGFPEWFLYNMVYVLCVNRQTPACVILDHVIVKFTTDIARKRAVAYLKKDVHCEHHAWCRLRDPACVILDHPGRPRDSKVYHRYCAQTCCYKKKDIHCEQHAWSKHRHLSYSTTPVDHVIVKFTTDIARKRAVAYLKKDVHGENELLDQLF